MLTFESVGTTLPNGATIVNLSARNAHEWIILARIEHERGDNEFVTWKASRPGDGSDTRWGHYFDTCAEAVADFTERA